MTFISEMTLKVKKYAIIAIVLMIYSASFRVLANETVIGKNDKIPVDLQLLLAVDVSQSIDEDEARLQRDGYLQALKDPDIIDIIKSGYHGRIALSYMEWAGPLQQWLLVNWQIVDSEVTAQDFANRLVSAPIRMGQRTSISFAILHAISIFRDSEYSSIRKVIDISGDGANNAGFYVHETRHRAVENGITINGLAILNTRPSPIGIPATKHIDNYYEDCVIAGPGAFIVVAEKLESFSAAVRRKMILEIAALSHNGVDHKDVRTGMDVALVNANFQTTDCLIGEKQLELYKNLKP